jgi:hypothetical protein
MPINSAKKPWKLGTDGAVFGLAGRFFDGEGEKKDFHRHLFVFHAYMYFGNDLLLGRSTEHESQSNAVSVRAGLVKEWWQALKN